MPAEFRLPELGENIEFGDLTKILVSVGDVVKQDQPILELETEKATIEVPSPSGGRIAQIHVKEGDKVKVGQVILTFDETGAGKIEAQPESKSREKEEAPERTEKTGQVEAQEPGKEPPEEGRRVVTEQAEQRETRAPAGKVVEMPSPAQPSATLERQREIVPAAPSVRRLARELGVDIHRVSGSGPGGRISVEDVKNHVRRSVQHQEVARPGVPLPALPMPDFSKWGEVERKAMTNVRRKTAERMSHAWTTIPHVTQYDKADITELEELRQRFGKRVEAAGGKLTVTAIAVKVAAAALKVFPQFAASVDAAREEIVFKKYFHIGVAVDTNRGLLVPVIRDTDKKNILELSVELPQLAEKARNKKITPEEMEGGVFTITNLGGIGGTQFSPIVKSPEVAILGISRANWEPVFMKEQFEPRLMLPLALSYDHRLIDGADAARFLRWVAEALQEPFLLPLQG